MNLNIPLPHGRQLDTSNGPAVMGIINVTPDSFWEGSRKSVLSSALETAMKMEADGALIVDIGGESTRPGAEYVDADQELERVIPVIEAIRKRSGIAISVDTRKSSVAKAAIDAGADIFNDISALTDDSDSARVASGSGTAVVLMHKKGIPATMQDTPYYGNVVAEVKEYLLEAALKAFAAGIRKESIIIDPGIGFGKRLEDNLALLSSLDELTATGYPVLVGLSRKSFVGIVTGRDVAGRLAGTLGATCAAYSKGASIFRVHDVADTVDALKAFSAAGGL